MPADGSGEIDRMEFTRLLLRLNIKQSEEALSALWSKIDEDGSGAISYEEFCVWWDRWKKPSHPRFIMFVVQLLSAQ